MPWEKNLFQWKFIKCQTGNVIFSKEFIQQSDIQVLVKHVILRKRSYYSTDWELLLLSLLILFDLLESHPSLY